MDELDPDDPRPPFQQVAAILKASILTGAYQPGDRLPSYTELAASYGVAVMTAQKAVGVLRDEGLVVSRQGKGSFVRQRTERSVGLRPHVEAMFDSGAVAIDFAGFSGETLQGVISEPLDKVRSGRLQPESLRIRILLPDLSKPVGLPALAPDGIDSPDVRKRAERIVQRSTQGIVETVEELAALGLVESASAQVRTYHSAPLFKLFLLNEAEAFFGFYPVLQHSVAISGQPVEIFDPMGKDAVLFHYAKSEDVDSVDSQYVEQAQKWFNSVWDSVAKDVEL
ncbi:GntR family transcriptional regulator [Amycolatopsis rhabdoformis]|uniref:GntR family transcriptional regulator n=1 Tax=Amycolatopsis rhabdoformis TaxID=1448059 RepID=A0ABZ1I1W9_9PSEU|nr:GntR family transcriptional regulator [Amycolatopsis rhabdoformis]WSE27921.1 GntR family transcriptional regulator [Amycolatopsis rhabdoformis]